MEIKLKILYLSINNKTNINNITNTTNKYK